MLALTTQEHPMTHDLTFMHFEPHDLPLCRTCGGAIDLSTWASNAICPGPVELFEVLSVLGGGAYIGFDRRMELANLVKRAVHRMMPE